MSAPLERRVSNKLPTLRLIGLRALLPPLQGEGWGGDGFQLQPTLNPTPLLASPLKGEEPVDKSRTTGVAHAC